MDKKMTDRVEQIGAIFAESDQVPLIEQYLERNHPAAWELAKLSNPSNLENFKAWLSQHDSAWALAIEVSRYPGKDWDELAQITGKSRETCRQTVQALQRGAIPPKHSA
jgi:hypothetical protein